MEKYFKNLRDGYITSIGTGCGIEEITQEEYENILSNIRNRPVAEVSYDYRLRADLTWELNEILVDDDPELSDSEAMNIILGGETQ